MHSFAQFMDGERFVTDGDEPTQEPSMLKVPPCEHPSGIDVEFICYFMEDQSEFR